MFEQWWWLWGGLLPAVIAAASVLTFARLRRRPAQPISAGAAVCSLFSGYIVGSLGFRLATQHSLPIPPVESSDYLAVVLLPAAVVAEMIGVLRPVPRWFLWLLRVVVAVAAPPLSLLSFIRQEWSLFETFECCAGLSLAIVALWVLLDLAARRGMERSTWLAMLIAAGGVGMTIWASVSVVVGQLGLTVAAALTGAWAASFIVGGLGEIAAGIGVAVILLAGLLMNGYFYGALPCSHALGLAVAAPAGALTGMIPWVRRLRRWQVTMIVATVTGAIVAAIAIPTLLTAMREANQSGY